MDSEAFPQHPLLGPGLHDDEIGPAEAVLEEHPLPKRRHLRQAGIALGVARHRIDEPPVMPVCPERHLAGHVLAAVVVVDLGVGFGERVVEARPAGVKEPNPGRPRRDGTT